MKNLQGLSPLWLISLAMVLGTAIVVLIPVTIATGDQIKSSDWTGFAGSIIGGVMTLMAATVAWFAVQRQIAIQQEIASKQTAIQQYAILQGTIAFLQDEFRLTEHIKMASESTKAIEAGLRVEPFANINIAAVRQVLEKHIGAATTLEEEFNRAGNNRWVLPEARDTRRQVRNQLLNLVAVQSHALSTVSGMWAKYQKTKDVASEDQAVLRAIDFEKKRREVMAACAKFEPLLNVEIERVFEKISAIRQQAGV